MPPKKRGRAKAPARAKRQAKKRPAKQAAKKPAKKAPKEDDVRRNRCFLITSKDSVKASWPTRATVTSLVLLEPSADLVESSDDFGSGSESDC